VGEDGRDGRLRDAVIFEVDEARILEAFEDSFGDGLLSRGVVGEEGRKVNELSRRVSRVSRHGSKT
jgi:hypothetical protein